MAFRWQPPVYSPLPAAAFAGLMSASSRGAADPRTRLARLLARDFGAEEVSLWGSGTEALQMALRAALPAVGDRAVVALPAFTCPEVATAAVGAGLRIALYDVDPHTLGPDLESLERVLRAGAGIVVAAPLYGLPLDWEVIAALARSYGAELVEDAAQGHGASWRGQPLGSLGALSILSFGRGKGWTGGAGGALMRRGVEADPALAATGLRAPAAHFPRSAGIAAIARSALQAVFGRPTLYGLPRALPFIGLGVTRYHEPGRPGGLPWPAASLVLGSREAAAAEAAARRRNATAYLERLPQGRGIAVPAVAAGADPGYLRLPILLPRGMDSFRHPDRALRLGIAPAYPRTLVGWPELRSHVLAAPGLDGAELLVARLATLPTHSLVSAAERERILELLGDIGR